MRVTEASLEALSERLARETPVDVLRFVHRTFGRRAAILTSMQRAGTWLCRLADRAGLDFDVLFVDTGVLHEETRRTRDELARAHTNLRVITLSPARTFAAQTAEEGLLYLSVEGQERCCELRKAAPLHAQRGRYDALVSALRQGEGGARSKVRPVGLDLVMGALRVHPLAHVTNAELNRALAEDPGVVVNPLHAMGFRTIGCFPCTTPVLPDEPERAGRWRHLASVQYCGINPVDRGAAEGAIELDDRYAEALGASPSPPTPLPAGEG
ncbi:phosphoadenosine phosphosulfate reductase family protein [Polyangium spumosum]|uniref:Phosphoadenosine phosphosulfate reductase family protein n=1 Tax=Polyangium spumosum TaxID=889282 RepID=A0A6N7PVA8_9BACT|nr:phosphoadenosine phosphosulfate reductase family protein [Polyangium spumosum]MRG94746.1 phosphoadenosine phosphosulfate reductase family protein [Polyangium spumosum]